MLTIRPEQIKILDAHMMRQYENRVIAKIAQAFPERFKAEGEDKTRQFVQAGIRKAAQYHLIEDEPVERYVLLLVREGLDFEQQPGREECRSILEDKETPEDAKVSLLASELADAAGAGPS